LFWITRQPMQSLTQMRSSLMQNFPNKKAIVGSPAIIMTRSTQPYVLTYMFCPDIISSYPLPFTWRITNENFQKILFSCNSSHNFTPKRNELRYHCCLSQLYFIARTIASCCSRKIE
jgi:hypothetical protein